MGGFWPRISVELLPTKTFGPHLKALEKRACISFAYKLHQQAINKSQMFIQSNGFVL